VPPILSRSRPFGGATLFDVLRSHSPGAGSCPDWPIDGARLATNEQRERPRNRQGSRSVIVGVMPSKSRAFGLCVAGAALLAAGCSSGAGKSSATTTTLTNFANPPATQPPTSVGLTPGRSAGPPHVVAKLGSCPPTRPVLSLTKLPSVVESLRHTLVPIAALNVRICEYSGIPIRLERLGQVVVPANVKSLEDTANRLPRSTDATCDQPDGAPFYLVTFANDARQVNISEDACGFLSNGVRVATSNAKWLEALHRYTSTYAPTMPTGAVSPAPTGVAG
jgi:hypothetical protein